MFCEVILIYMHKDLVKLATLSKADDEEKRLQVLDLVNLHYEKCEIEALSYSTLVSSNFMMKMMLPRKINAAIARYIDFTPKFFGVHNLTRT